MWKWPALQRSHRCPVKTRVFISFACSSIAIKLFILAFNVLLAEAVSEIRVALRLVVDAALYEAAARPAAERGEVPIVCFTLVALGAGHARLAVALALWGALQGF
jgi:hypothetical protein